MLEFVWLNQSVSKNSTEKSKQLKKTGTGGSDFRLLIRLTVLVAYYQKQAIERIAGCLNISVKSVKRWIKRYKSKGIDFVRDEDRSGRPSGLSIEQQEHLKNKIQQSNQRVGVARHVVVLIQTLFGVLYSVGYLPSCWTNWAWVFTRRRPHW